jgi:hypothetical protein
LAFRQADSAQQKDAIGFPLSLARYPEGRGGSAEDRPTFPDSPTRTTLPLRQLFPHRQRLPAWLARR